jgi:hypothetical protein
MNFAFILKRKRDLLLLLSVFFLLEALSFLSFFFPLLNTIVFISISLLVLFLALYRFKLAIYVLLSELFINSMGYIFFLEASGMKLSLRISLWLIVMAVCLAKIVLELMRHKKTEIINRYKKIPFFYAYFSLGVFVVFALVWGIFQNGFSDAFFDFNAWLYLALLLPLWQTYSESKNKEKFKQNIVILFLTGVLYLTFKSLLLLFIFSHGSESLILDVYRWTRDYYLGEATIMSGGFYRVFLQAQIFILFGFLFSLTGLILNSDKKIKIVLLGLTSFLASALILNFSRSFWVGGFVSLIFLFLFLWKKYSFKKMFMAGLYVLLSLIIGFLLVVAVVKFPWPNSSANFGLDSLSERARINAPESAISSRWALLEVMKQDLRTNFLIGRGFGARLEYKSSDPRVLERSADGIYSTYAFEWGWFDIWLKLGLLGVFLYAYLLFLILKNLFLSLKRENIILPLALFISLISLIAINFFTPYLNHPLGIGFVLLSLLFLSKKGD